jgi:hypothetical protein
VTDPSPKRKGHRSSRALPRAVLHQGMFAAANGRFLRILGYQCLADLEAVPFLDLVPPAGRPEVKQLFLNAEKLASVDNAAEIFLRTADGDAICPLARFERVRFNDEDCVQVTLSPVTGRRQGGSAEQEYSPSLEQLLGAFAKGWRGLSSPPHPVASTESVVARSHMRGLMPSRADAAQNEISGQRHRIQAICDYIVDHSRALLIASTIFAAVFLLLLAAE